MVKPVYYFFEDFMYAYFHLYLMKVHTFHIQNIVVYSRYRIYVYTNTHTHTTVIISKAAKYMFNVTYVEHLLLTVAFYRCIHIAHTHIYAADE